MALINHAELEGHMTDNAKLNHTKKGTPVTTFALANDRTFKDATGKLHTSTDYPIITLWGKRANVLCKYAGKGSLISIEGYNHTRHYQNKHNERVFVQEIIASNMQMLKSKRPGNSDNKSSNSKSSTTSHTDSTKPLSATSHESNDADEATSQANKLNISDNDLPF